jgi:GT2 family glycosyltransferase
LVEVHEEVAFNPAAMKPLVTLQMLMYGESLEVLDRAIGSLQNVRYPRDKWRIVLVSNAHADRNTFDNVIDKWMPKVSVTLPEISLLRMDPNGGFAGGHQFAYEEGNSGDSDYVYLFNADGELHPDALSNAVAHLESNLNTAIAQSYIHLLKEPELLNSSGNCLHYLGFGFSDGYRKSVWDANSKVPHFYASGAGVLIRTNIIEKIGGLFDPTYFLYHEDTDVSWRARLAGYDIAIIPTSKMFHDYEFSSSITKFYWMERNRILTELTHLKIGTLILMIPSALLMEFGGLFYALKTGWLMRRLSVYSHFLKLSTWSYIKKRRQFIRSIRKVKDKEILRHMVGRIEAQEVDNPILRWIVNPILEINFRILKILVVW